MRFFAIHLALYVGGVAAAAAVNLMLDPKVLWFPWVAIAWGIALAAHAISLLLETAHRRERIFVDPKARGFVVHLFVYAATCLTLLAVNLLMTPKVWWFYWPILGWGAGVLAHGWCAFGKHRPLSPLGAAVVKAREEQAKSAARTKPARKRSAPVKKPSAKKPSAKKPPARKSSKPKR